MFDSFIERGLGYESLTWLCCAFGAGRSYILAMKQGPSYVIYHEDLPQKLVDWLFHPTSGAYLRDVSSLKVTLGEKGAFFAMDKHGYRWDALPSNLEAFIQEGFKSTGSDMPRLVALGNDQGSLVVSTQGRVQMDMKPSLGRLFAEIKGMGRDILVCFELFESTYA